MSRCKHENKIEVGSSQEGMGDIIVEWCPECGGLKRTMTNWECRNYRWRLPKAKPKKEPKPEPRMGNCKPCRKCGRSHPTYMKCR